ncbi:hypothetical protein J527_3358 [Acinetobacter baumannii 1267820]|nr:hypothetical protein J527_3358 [Acinetobacter baumannii 1267820]
MESLLAVHDFGADYPCCEFSISGSISFICTIKFSSSSVLEADAIVDLRMPFLSKPAFLILLHPCY